jgi:hypothetical protein
MMNRFLGFASLGLAIVALAVALSKPQEVAVPTGPTEHPFASSSQDVQALEKRVKALEDTAVGLSSRLMALERRPGGSEASAGGAAGAPPAALAQEVEQLKTEVRGLIAGEALNSQGGREYLKEMVRSVQDEMRTTQRQERQQQWTQTQAQAQTERAERVHKFASEAGLNYSQEQELTRRLQDEDTQRQALLDAVSAGSKSPRDIRQDMRTLRTQTDEAMQKLLTDEQRVKYEEMRREDRGPMRQGGWQPGGTGGRPASP